jgi:L-lactate dehydrogenase complex protein LldG
MAQSSDARRAILDSVRARLKESGPTDAAAIGRPYDRGPSSASLAGGQQDTASRIAWFQQSLASVGGKTVRVTSDREAARAIDQIITKSAARRIALSDAAVVERVVAMIEGTAERVRAPVGVDELLGCDIGVTSAQWAIAETGTLVLESDREQHRLISLVPPVHVAIVEAARICTSLVDALALVRGRRGAGLSRAVTFITGPSRTGDIEMVLTIGVHGPQELHVIIKDEG